MDVFQWYFSYTRGHRFSTSAIADRFKMSSSRNSLNTKDPEKAIKALKSSPKKFMEEIIFFAVKHKSVLLS